MDASSEHLAEIRRLKSNIAAQRSRLERMLLAPANGLPSTEIRQAALRIDFERSRLLVIEDIARKFDPNQPRVPAGNGDPSGEWTSTGGQPGIQANPSGGRNYRAGITTLSS